MKLERAHFKAARGPEVRLSLYGVTRHGGTLHAEAYLLHAPLGRARTLRGHGLVIAAPKVARTQEVIFEPLTISIQREA